jgi:hypothetical protein
LQVSSRLKCQALTSTIDEDTSKVFWQILWVVMVPMIATKGLTELLFQNKKENKSLASSNNINSTWVSPWTKSLTIWRGETFVLQWK